MFVVLYPDNQLRYRGHTQSRKLDLPIEISNTGKTRLFLARLQCKKLKKAYFKPFTFNRFPESNLESNVIFSN